MAERAQREREREPPEPGCASFIMAMGRTALARILPPSFLLVQGPRTSATYLQTYDKL